VTGIQTPIGGWHREPNLGYDVRDARATPTKKTAVTPEVSRVLASAKNPMPEFHDAAWPNTFMVSAPGSVFGTAKSARWLYRNTGMNVLFHVMCCTIILGLPAVIMGMIYETQTEKKILRQLGWKERGDCVVLVGLYEWKNGKATRLGLNHPGDGR
jgi:hypothetical protein